MNTVYKKVSADDIDMSVIRQAGEIIRAGGLVAFPTETVYGLGGDALDASSAKKIYNAKGRPSDNPLIVHIADTEKIYDVAASVPKKAIMLADSFWPGPLTMILEKRPEIPKEVTGGLDTVAIRLPSHPVARQFIRQAGGFIAAPSANLSGRPSPTTADHVRQDMDGRIDMLIDAGPCTIGLESTIVDLTSSVPMILRPGYVNTDMLESVIGHVEKDPAVFGSGDPEAVPKAPGMKYKHYAPKGQLSIVSGERADVVRYIKECLDNKKSGERIAVLSASEDAKGYSGADFVGDIGSIDDEDEIAASLYDMLRRCDEENIDTIFSEEFYTPRLGQAIMNRLIRAAGHRIIKV